MRYFFIIVYLASLAPLLQAEEFSVGVLSFEEELNFISGQSPLEELVRQVVTEPLLTASYDQNGKLILEFRLASQVQASPEGDIWSLKLKSEEIYFHNHQQVRYKDIDYSLRKCPALTSILRGVKSTATDKIQIELLDSRHDFPVLLSQCPILPEQLSQAPKQAGRGTFTIGSGSYWIREYKPGRYIRLQRFPSYFRKGEGANRLEIRHIRDTIQALQGLRSGTLVAVLTNANQQLREASRNDETLVLSQCSFGEILHRRNVTWSCKPRLDLTELHYVS